MGPKAMRRSPDLIEELQNVKANADEQTERKSRSEQEPKLRRPSS